MNKVLCSLACTWMTIIDSQLYILLTVYLKMFHWNEMLTWWLPGCNFNWKSMCKQNIPSSDCSWLSLIKNYCKSGNLCENFIFANSVKRHTCDVKNPRLGHDLPISVMDSVIWRFGKDFNFTKLRIT